MSPGKHYHSMIFRMLDLLFVSDPDLILNCEREVNEVISDHDNVNVTLAFSDKREVNDNSDEATPSLNKVDFLGADEADW